MLSSEWKERFLRIPGARRVVNHLLSQGHSKEESETGGLLFSGLMIFLLAIIFDGFILGLIRSFFAGVWDFVNQNPVEGVLAGLFATMAFLAILFRGLQRQEHKTKLEKTKARQEQAKHIFKKETLQRGAMGHFEDVFRAELAVRYPEIQIKSIHVVDTVPRIRFNARMFRTEFGGEVGKNYRLFRDSLLQDTVHIMETGFSISENIQALVVDGMMNFINRKAAFYDGAVISVKALRDVFRQTNFQVPNLFKALAAFDLRYNDGMEVEALPEDENKTARILERIKQQAPRLDIRYESTKKGVVDEGWEEAATPSAAPTEVTDSLKGKPLSSIPLAQFQDLAVGLLTQLGFDVGKVKKIPGGTLQILADFQHPVIGGNFMILARQYPETASVHADLVRELDELTREEGCKRGIYLVTGQFTEEAKNISRKMAVDLVDGQKLKELLDTPSYDRRWVFRSGDEKGLVLNLSTMSLLDFEKEVDQFLKILGFHVSKVRRAVGGSVIAVVEHSHPVIGGKFAVLAKQFPETTQVPAEIVSEFAHVMASEFCYRGLLLVPAYFSMEARALSRFSGVDLVDHSLWENLRRRHLDPG